MPTKLEKYLSEAAAAAEAAVKYEASGLTDVANEYREIARLWRSLADGQRRRDKMRSRAAT